MILVTFHHYLRHVKHATATVMTHEISQRVGTVRQYHSFRNFCGFSLGSKHLSPNVKALCNFEPQVWLEMITSQDAKSAQGRHVV